MPTVYHAARVLDGEALIDERTKSLRRLDPELFTRTYKHVVYVGASHVRQHYLDDLTLCADRLTVIEAFADNAAWLRERGYVVRRASVLNCMPPFDVDLTFWWHGPEHATSVELDEFLARWPGHLVLGCPWGDVPQDVVYGNTFEQHLSAWTPELLEARGFDCDVVGLEGRLGSNIAACRHRP